MENKPIISIIVPIYDVEDYIDRCIESILNQTFKDFELILVDDGSPDNCPAICDKWAEKDSRVKVIHKPNGGVSSARNAGLALASGEYVGFCDPDDKINERMYDLLYQSILENNSDCCVCSYKSFKTDSDIESSCSDKRNVLVLNGNEIIEYFLGDGRNMLASIWTKLINRKLIEKLRFNEAIAFGEDYCFALETLLNCSKVTMLENCELYYYFLREDSAMKKVNSEKYYKLFVEKQRIFKLCQSKYHDEATTKIVQNAETRAIVATFLNADEKVASLVKTIAKSSLKNVLKSKEIFWKEKLFYTRKLVIGK